MKAKLFCFLFFGIKRDYSPSVQRRREIRRIEFLLLKTYTPIVSAQQCNYTMKQFDQLKITATHWLRSDFGYFCLQNFSRCRRGFCCNYNSDRGYYAAQTKLRRFYFIYLRHRENCALRFLELILLN